MSPIDWNDVYNVGDMEVDEQHKEWVRIFNELEASVLHGNPGSLTDTQKKVLKEIIDFTDLHFATEERLMAERGYPEVVRHKRMHKEFSQIVYDQYRLILEGDVVLNSELLKLIRTWFMNHTATEDKKAFSHAAMTAANQE